MKKIIKIFDPAVGVQEKKILEKTFRSHFWSSGLGIGNVSIFEDAFRKYVGSDECVAVNSGSADGATIGQTAAGVSSGGSYELNSGFQNTLNRTSGCTDDTACNFNADAGIDDGSCITAIYGCMDSLALNYDPIANADDNTCYYCSITTNVAE